ncbi:MAG: hypothetical protein AAFX96_06420, partial [Pseudomonadota bacterium]
MGRSTITEAELIKLNALVDGELEDMEAAELRLEIAANQHLADAYELILSEVGQVHPKRQISMTLLDFSDSESV